MQAHLNQQQQGGGAPHVPVAVAPASVLLASPDCSGNLVATPVNGRVELVTPAAAGDVAVAATGGGGDSSEC